MYCKYALDEILAFTEGLFFFKKYIFKSVSDFLITFYIRSKKGNDHYDNFVKVKSRKKEMKFFLYIHDDHVDVVKQWKKKVTSFSIRSEYLQNYTTLNSVTEKA